MIHPAEIQSMIDRRFPTAIMHDGALKVCEEAGEVAAALNKGQGIARLADELADVIIACQTTAVLAGIDLEPRLHARWEEVRRR